MAEGLEQLKVIRERLKSARLDIPPTEFNTQRGNVWSWIT